MSGHVIYALTVGGGVLGISPLPGRQGSYRADVEHFMDWRPSIVVSLTTLTEMVEYNAQSLGADVRAFGARWIHLPVQDFGTPENATAGNWENAENLTLAALKGGGRVLAHCLGGCGRSGMFVLRMMVRSGESPEAALSRLRRVRACAVETEEQFIWAASIPTASS